MSHPDKPYRSEEISPGGGEGFEGFEGFDVGYHHQRKTGVLPC